MKTEIRINLDEPIRTIRNILATSIVELVLFYFYIVLLIVIV